MCYTTQSVTHCTTYTTLHNLYHTTQLVPHCTTTTTTNHCSLSDHYSSTDHCPLYQNTHQHVHSTCTDQYVSHINQLSKFEFAHQAQSTWVKPTTHTAHPIWVKPTAHKATCANPTQLNKPVPNSESVADNLYTLITAKSCLYTNKSFHYHTLLMYIIVHLIIHNYWTSNYALLSLNIRHASSCIIIIGIHHSHRVCILIIISVCIVYASSTSSIHHSA